MSYIQVTRHNFRGVGGLGAFGKGAVAPPPEPPPEIAPTLTPEEEQAILQSMQTTNLTVVEPSDSFIQRNKMPLIIGGGVVTLATLGLILMTT